VSVAQATTLAAFTANASGCAGVGSIEGVTLPAAPELQDLLVRALATQAGPDLKRDWREVGRLNRASLRVARSRL